MADSIPKGNFSLWSRNSLLTLIAAMLVWLGMVQAGFFLIQENLAAKTEKLVMSQVKVSVGLLNYDHLIRLLLTFETEGLIQCLSVALKEPADSQARPIVIPGSSCSGSALSLSGSHRKLSEALPSGTRWSLEFKVVNRGSFYLGLWAFRILGLALVIVAGFAHLIRQRSHEVVLQSRIAAAEAKALVARQVSHDIRSPLTALQTLVSVAQGLSPVEKNLLSSVSSRIQGIADDLLKERTLIKNQHALRDLLHPLVSEKRLEWQDTHIQILEDLQGGSLPIEADPQKVQRIVSNLINNSIEALGSTAGAVSLRSRTTPQGILIQVTDSGPGFPAEVLDSLSTGGRGITTTKPHGHGLGLIDAKGYLESLGGHLQLESRRRLGSSVSLWIPDTTVKGPGRQSRTWLHSLFRPQWSYYS